MVTSNARALAIRYLPIDAVRPNRNPRKHSDQQIKIIAQSIEAFDCIVPIVTDHTGTILAGHGRWLACRRLGRSRVPTIPVEHLTEVQAQAFMVADNRLGEMSGWDDEVLAGIFKELSASPDGVWEHYGLTPAEAKQAGMNSQMFNSFLDGTKSAIEMAAVANACSLDVPHDGLGFPPCGADDLASVLRPRHLGGALANDGMVEVVSSLRRDGQPVERDLRWGVYVVFKAESDYAALCFKQYGLPTDSTGRYAAMYKPYHLIGLELSISVLNVTLRGEPTGTCREWRGDAVAVAKRALKAGEMLDGEGGYTVYAKLIPAARSRKLGGLPIGLANHVKLVRDIAAGDFVTAADVALAEKLQAVRVRREMEAQAQDSTEVADTTLAATN